MPEDQWILDLKIGDFVRYVKNTQDPISEKYEPTIGVEGVVIYISPEGQNWVEVEFKNPANEAGDTVLVFHYDELEGI